MPLRGHDARIRGIHQSLPSLTKQRNSHVQQTDDCPIAAANLILELFANYYMVPKDPKPE